MDSEILYWTRFNFAISSFCHEIAHQENSMGELVHAMGGDGKWHFVIRLKSIKIVSIFSE